MIKNRILKLLAGVLLMATAIGNVQAQKIVVAHRGASGYLPEHTLEAKAMAYAMGADYLEQDVVMTADNALIVLHDITLERTTDVAVKFPGKARDDGRYYAVDFTLAQIRTLGVREGVSNRSGTERAIYPDRFPVGKSTFRINTLAEEIEFVQGLNLSTGRNVGIYPEIKSPAFHRAEGKDLSSAVVDTLKQYGYTSKQDKVFIQTFEFDELKIIHDTILPAAGIDVNLVMLLANDEGEYGWMLTEEGMATLSTFADGVGPEKGMIIDNATTPGKVVPSNLVTLAHANGMQVHPYTFRSDAGQVPEYASSFAQLLEYFYIDADVDGVFTDFPDLAVDYLKSRNN